MNVPRANFVLSFYGAFVSEGFTTRIFKLKVYRHYQFKSSELRSGSLFNFQNGPKLKIERELLFFHCGKYILYNCCKRLFEDW